MKNFRRIMIFFVVAILCFATAGLLMVNSKDNIFESDSKLTTYYDEEKTIDIADVNAIRVNVISSDVEIYSSEESLVKITIKGKSLILGMKDEREFTVDTVDDVLEIIETQKSNSWIGTTIYNDVTIKVYLPSQFDGEMNIKGVSTDVEITNQELNDYLQVETVSGEIELTQIQAKDLNLKTVSGDILLKDINTEEATLKTVSGDIEGTRVNGDLIMRTTSGDIDLIYLSEIFDIEIETVSGDIELDLLNHVQFNYDFDTVSGDIDVRLDDLKKNTNRSLNGEIGDTDNRIYIKTVSGDIELD